MPAYPPTPPLPLSQFNLDSPGLRISFALDRFENPTNDGDVNLLYKDGGLFAQALATFLDCNATAQPACDIIMPTRSVTARSLSTTIGPVYVVWSDITSTTECFAPPPAPPQPDADTEDARRQLQNAPEPTPMPESYESTVPPAGSSAGPGAGGNGGGGGGGVGGGSAEQQLLTLLRQIVSQLNNNNGGGGGGGGNAAVSYSASGMAAQSGMAGQSGPINSGPMNSGPINSGPINGASVSQTPASTGGGSASPRGGVGRAPWSRANLDCDTSYVVTQAAFAARDYYASLLRNITIVNSTRDDAFDATIYNLNGTVLRFSASPVVDNVLYPRPYFSAPSPPPVPFAPPPPSVPPAPPVQPPGLCTNTCNSNQGSAGVCDDGGPGAATAFCTLGVRCVPPAWHLQSIQLPTPLLATSLICPALCVLVPWLFVQTDCDDCQARDRATGLGDRGYCVSCPEACRERNQHLIETRGASAVGLLCLEDMLGNDQCDPGCNNRECNYDSVGGVNGPPSAETGWRDLSGPIRYECTPTQVRTACLEAQAASYVDVATPPGRPVPMAFSLQLGQGRLSINSDLNQMIWLQEMEYTLQWSDMRLFESECAGALAQRSASTPSMASISKISAMSFIERGQVQERRNWYWFPALDFPDLRPVRARPATPSNIGV